MMTLSKQEMHQLILESIQELVADFKKKKKDDDKDTESLQKHQEPIWLPDKEKYLFTDDTTAKMEEDQELEEYLKNGNQTIARRG